MRSTPPYIKASMLQHTERAPVTRHTFIGGPHRQAETGPHVWWATSVVNTGTSTGFDPHLAQQGCRQARCHGCGRGPQRGRQDPDMMRCSAAGGSPNLDRPCARALPHACRACPPQEAPAWTLEGSRRSGCASMAEGTPRWGCAPTLGSTQATVRQADLGTCLHDVRHSQPSILTVSLSYSQSAFHTLTDCRAISQDKPSLA